MSDILLGIAAPIVDLYINVDDAFIDSVGEKGGMEPVDYDTLQLILQRSGKNPKSGIGGSCANVIRSMAQLGHRCRLFGKVGDDELGTFWVDRVKKLGIESRCLVAEGATTTQALVLVTPDGERTMRTFLGAAHTMKASDIDASLFDDVALVHVEGFALENDNGEYVKKVVQQARRRGCLVTLDCSSCYVVTTFKALLTELVENGVDIVFANEKEATTFTGLDDAHNACQALCRHAQAAVVTLGECGCFVAYRNEVHHFPSHPVGTVVDTTGAGDSFAGGFLHEWLRGGTIARCADTAGRLAAAIIQRLGVEGT